jgi:hypothetical protein
VSREIAASGARSKLMRLAIDGSGSRDEEPHVPGMPLHHVSRRFRAPHGLLW